METRVRTYINYGDVAADARHGTPQFNTTMAFVALYSLVYDSNQTRTKGRAIEKVNQTV